MNYLKRLLILSCCTLLVGFVSAQNISPGTAWLTPENSSEAISEKEIGQDVLVMTEANEKRRVKKARLQEEEGRLYVKLGEGERLIYVSLSGGVPTDDGYVDEQNFVMNRVGEAFTPAGISANSLTMAVKESAIDTEDVDLQGRVRHIPETSPVSFSHSAYMATMITGDGISGPKARGVAPGAIVYSIGYGVYTPEPEDFYLETGIRVQNHSYSAYPPFEYGITPAEYDRVATAIPDLLFVASAGNRGLMRDTSGELFTAYSTISAEYKMAKNMLLIGAQGDGAPAQQWSSRGPTVDNRLKPEFVVYGRNGTSGSAAITSGLSLLLREACQEITGREEVSSALMRATMIASAVPVSEVPGPSFIHGYGALDGEAAFEVISKEQFFEEELTTSQPSVSIPLSPAHTDRRLRICLSWLDPPAEPGTPNPLMNDLDLRVISPDGEVLLPWVWDEVGTPAETFGRPFGKARDWRNVNEVIDVDLPLDGEYQIEVSSLSAVNQKFSVAYSYLEPTLPLAWIGPNRDNPGWAGNVVDLDWQGRGLTEDPVPLQWKPVDADEWQTITDSAYLNRNYYGWQAPEGVYGLVQVRLLPPGQSPAVSEIFLLSPKIDAKLLQNCDQAFLLQWTGLAPDFAYELTSFESGSPQIVDLLTDTLLNDVALPNNYYQIRPRHISGYQGLESRLYQRETEEEVCYLKIQYYGTQGNGRIYIATVLNTIYEPESVSLLRREEDGRFVTVETQNELSTNELAPDRWYDNNTVFGENYYRFEIVMPDGLVMEGPSIIIDRLEGELIPVPNPANGSIRFYSDNWPFIAGQEVVIYDMLGREVVSLSNPGGIYYISDWREGTYLAVHKDADGKRIAATTFVVQR